MKKEDLSQPYIETNLDCLTNSDLLLDKKIIIHHDGFKFECLWQPSHLQECKLVILFSSGGRTNKTGMTSFARWSYPNKFNVLNIEDPMYKLYPELTTAWYYGTREKSLLNVVAEVIKKIQKILGIFSKDVVFIGSSAGGYASLLMTALLPGSNCIAMNPQVNLVNWGKVAESFAERTNNDIHRNSDFRNNICEFLLKYSTGRVLVTSNINTPRDWDKQTFLFYKSLFENLPTKSGLYKKKNFNFLLSNQCYTYPHSLYFSPASLYLAIDWVFGWLNDSALERLHDFMEKEWRVSEDSFFYSLWFNLLEKLSPGYQIKKFKSNIIDLMVGAETVSLRYIKPRESIQIICNNNSSIIEQLCRVSLQNLNLKHINKTTFEIRTKHVVDVLNLLIEHRKH